MPIVVKLYHSKDVTKIRGNIEQDYPMLTSKSLQLLYLLRSSSYMLLRDHWTHSLEQAVYILCSSPSPESKCPSWTPLGDTRWLSIRHILRSNGWSTFPHSISCTTACARTWNTHFETFPSHILAETFWRVTKYTKNLKSLWFCNFIPRNLS